MSVPGVSTCCLHGLPLGEALDRIIPLTRTIEVMDEGLHYLSSADPLLSYPARYTIHAPSRGVNPASTLEPIRRASVEVILECAAIAAEVGAGIVIHPGYAAWHEERDRSVVQLQRSLVTIREACQDLGAAWFLENMGNWDYFHLRYPVERDVIGPFRLALDVGHANLNHVLPSFLAGEFSHVHLHDNKGDEDSHAALGTGSIDLEAVAKAIGERGVTPVLELGSLPDVEAGIRFFSSIMARMHC